MKKLTTLFFTFFTASAIPLTAYIGALYPQEECRIPWISGEFLYWKAYQGGMEYADSYTPAIGDLANADAHEIRLKSAPGFRIEAGYLTPFNIDCAISYTRFRTTASDSVTGTLFPTLNYFGSAAGGLATTVTRASADWNLLFQTLDVGVGQAYNLCSSVLLRPHANILAAWIDQSAHIEYAGGGIAVGSYTIALNNDFWGVGLKVGLDTHYAFCESFSLFTELDTALLFGRFDIKQTQTQAGVEQINLSESYHRLNPILQAQLGLAWKQPYFFGCSIPFIISAALEWQYWWNQNQTERFTSGTFPIHVDAEQDLGLFGLTIKGIIYF